VRVPRSLTVGMAAAVLCAGLTGCSSLEQLTSSSTPLPGAKPAASPSASPSPSAATQAVKLPARPSGALDTGTATHRLKQGNFSVQLAYWTSDNAKLYTAESVKTINVAAHIEDADSTHRVTVSTFQVIQDDGTKRATVTTDNGKFDVTPPYPYNTVVTLPAATAGATALTLTVRLDLLVETAPESGSYYRSTALDTLTLPLLTKGPNA
jgi:glucose/arabinose dehydrogenase